MQGWECVQDSVLRGWGCGSSQGGAQVSEEWVSGCEYVTGLRVGQAGGMGRVVCVCE